MLAHLLVALLLSQSSPAATNPERLADGIRLTTAGGVLTLQVKSDTIVRVTFAKTTSFRADDMVVIGPPGPAPAWSTSTSGTAVTLKTAKLQVRVSLNDG